MLVSLFGGLLMYNFQVSQASTFGIALTPAPTCTHLPSHHLVMRFWHESHCWSRAEVTQMIKDLVITFATTLEAYNIEYWLDSGTLLGAIRSGGVIPHDVDADFGLTHAAFNKLRHTNMTFPSTYILEVLYSPIYRDGGRDDALPGRFIDTRSGLYIDLFEFHPWRATDEVTESIDLSSSVLEKEAAIALASQLGLQSLQDLNSSLVFGSASAITVTFNKTYDAWSPIESSCWNCQMCKNQFLFEVPIGWVHPLRRCSFENVSLWCPGESEKYLTKLYDPEYMRIH
ncbi:hypothetical protein ACHHYP_16300 [Achlya hypogyna]|uniref:Secreted protein n=1 Tax=Achlya hypogyna TaxID=1202772 RepID=A0A0A7CNN7_ACHHY|nr:secreted protein [Achlya hypogyna]OQR82269.1 hypothetical protein ACHHYP_16300 [Achlya hypogyna]